MASEKQAAFVRSLFEQVEQTLGPISEEPSARGLLDRVEAVKSAIVTCLGNDPIAVDALDRAEVSAAIDTLMAVRDESRKLGEQTSIPAGIAATAPDKVVPNRFQSDCDCGATIPTAQGWAVLHGRKWVPWCLDCSVLMPEERTARITAARAVEDEASKRQAALEAEFDDLARQLWSRTQLVSERRKGGRNVGVAIADSTGRNDLRFYRIRQGQHADRASVFEVIGGRSDTRLDIEPAIAALTTIVAVPDLLDAMIAFGRELNECGRCGETLTKEESRLRGIGPVCARKVA